MLARADLAEDSQKAKECGTKPLLVRNKKTLQKLISDWL